MVRRHLHCVQISILTHAMENEKSYKYSLGATTIGETSSVSLAKTVARACLPLKNRHNSPRKVIFEKYLNTGTSMLIDDTIM